MNLAPVLKQRFFDANGLPLAGGQLFSYLAGTTTPQATYSNSGGTPNTNPVVLDANGYADVWLDPSVTYKFVLEDSNNNVLWTEDNVSLPLGITTWSTNFTYQQGSIVADSSGQGLFYVSLINNNQGQALTNVSAWRRLDGNIRTVTANTTILVTDNEIRSNSASGSLAHTLPACSTTPIGTRITVKDIGSAGNTTSVKGTGTDLVDGNNTYASALQQYNSATFINTGTSWDVLSNASTFIPPTVQKFTSGSGTYTLPTSPRKPVYIRVKVQGGGGGGGGYGSISPTAGGNGVASTFGTSLVSAGGGVGGATSNGSAPGGAGGTPSLTTSATVIQVALVTGGMGGGASQGSNTVYAQGGMGGSSYFGGAGSSGAAAAPGQAGAANTGGGGGGAGTALAGAANSGSGGGPGSYVEALIINPSATYSYSVGAGGSAGTIGSAGGYGGGAGGSGIIIIEEYYS